MVARIGPRLANEPGKYVRRVKGGKYQARPYCSIEGERYTLPGLFPTEGAAERAVLEFWQGKRPDAPKYTKTIHTRLGPRYLAVVPWAPGETHTAGPFAARDEAAAAAAAIVRRLAGPLFAPLYLSRRESAGPRATPARTMGRT